MEARDPRMEPRGGGSPRLASGNAPAGRHEVVLKAREQATISGVLHVASFDDHEIVLDTNLGALTVLGHELQIKQLDLAQGTFWVEGLIDSLAYAPDRKSARNAAGGRRGMFGRMFR